MNQEWADKALDVFFQGAMPYERVMTKQAIETKILIYRKVMEQIKAGNYTGGFSDEDYGLFEGEIDVLLDIHEICLPGITSRRPLMKYDINGVPQPFLLESISGDTGNKIWLMKVKQGIKFSDGSDLNAEAVAWNINIYKEKGIFKDSFYAAVNEAVAVDEYTVEVRMNNWDSLFPYTLARLCRLHRNNPMMSMAKNILRNIRSAPARSFLKNGRET